MTAVLATRDTTTGPFVRYTGGSSTADNEVSIQATGIGEYNTFMLMSTAGAMDVLVSLDGTNYATAALSLTDLGAADTLPVLVTVAGRVYGFRGSFAGVKVLQNGATGVTAPVLVCSRL